MAVKHLAPTRHVAVTVNMALPVVAGMGSQQRPRARPLGTFAHLVFTTVTNEAHRPPVLRKDFLLER